MSWQRQFYSEIFAKILTVRITIYSSLPISKFIIKKVNESWKKQRTHKIRKWKIWIKPQPITELATGVTLSFHQTMSLVFADSMTLGAEERTLADRMSQVKSTSNLRTWALSERSDGLADGHPQFLTFSFIFHARPTQIWTLEKPDRKHEVHISSHTFKFAASQYGFECIRLKSFATL